MDLENLGTKHGSWGERESRESSSRRRSLSEDQGKRCGDVTKRRTGQWRTLIEQLNKQIIDREGNLTFNVLQCREQTTQVPVQGPLIVNYPWHNRKHLLYLRTRFPRLTPGETPSPEGPVLTQNPRTWVHIPVGVGPKEPEDGNGVTPPVSLTFQNKRCSPSRPTRVGGRSPGGSTTNPPKFLNKGELVFPSFMSPPQS